MSANVEIIHPLSKRINNALVDYEFKNRLQYSAGHPQSINFLMIERCNSKCVMCGGDYYGTKSDKILTFENYKKLVANLNMNKVSNIVYGGAGDPLLSKYLPDIVEYTAENFRHISLRVITNAIALDDRLSRLLLKCNTYFTISVNATNPETYKKIHEVDCFDQVYANVKRLTDIRDEMGSSSTVELSAVITRRNIEELASFVNMTRDLNCIAIKLLYCRYYPAKLRFKESGDDDNKLLEKESLFFHQALAKKYMLEAKKRAEDYGIRLWTEPTFGSVVHPHPCYSPWKTIYIGF
ncbi:MAG: radical SAM protein, partial [Thermodesulfobacteriota bacterium]